MITSALLDDPNDTTTEAPSGLSVMDEVLFRSAVDAEFRASLLNDPAVVVGAKYDVDRSLLEGRTFVEIGEASASVTVLPRMIEEGASLSHREIVRLGMNAEPSCVLPLTLCFFTCETSCCESKPSGGGCWFTDIATE